MTYLIIAYTLNIFDYIMTVRLVKQFGIEIERNPLGRWMIEHSVAWVVKIFIMGGLFALMGYLIRRYPKLSRIAYIPLGVYGLLTVYHIIVAIKIWTVMHR